MANVGYTRKDITIASSGTTPDDGVELTGAMRVGFVFPTMTGTTMTFTASDTKDGTYVAVNGVSVTIASDNAVGLSAADVEILSAFRWIKPVFASQASARTVVMVTKDWGS